MQRPSGFDSFSKENRDVAMSRARDKTRNVTTWCGKRVTLAIARGKRFCIAAMDLLKRVGSQVLTETKNLLQDAVEWTRSLRHAGLETSRLMKLVGLMALAGGILAHGDPIGWHHVLLAGGLVALLSPGVIGPLLQGRQSAGRLPLPF